MAGPVTRRLAAESARGPARWFLIAALACGLAVTGLILAQAGLLARILATAGTGSVDGALGALLIVLIGRAAAAWGGEFAALRAAIAVKDRLRTRVLERALDRGPDWLERQRTGEITTLATAGLDALDPYFARYLPQLLLAVAVPAAVISTVLSADWLSGLIIVVTLPVIPVFAALIGQRTKAQTGRSWAQLARLSGHFLDVVRGLPTLKIFGRAKAQEQVIARVTDQYRVAVMANLRVAFLSALVLELAAAVATALVAVEVGLRLLYGHMDYSTALFVLLLTPEAFLPVRNAAAAFHASAEGTAAASLAFEIIDGEGASTPSVPAPDLRREPIVLDRVTLTYPGRPTPVIDSASLTIWPGDHITLIGSNGAGKTTLLKAFLQMNEFDLAQLGWLPQQPSLFAWSVAENIALGRPGADRAAVERAARLAGAGYFIAALPKGYDTVLDERGLRLSAGQRQKIALARLFLKDAPVLLLDEPTAHLDPVSAAEVDAAIGSLAAGRTVITVTHRRLASFAARGRTRVIWVGDGRIQELVDDGLAPSLCEPEDVARAGPAAVAPVQAGASASEPVTGPEPDRARSLRWLLSLALTRPLFTRALVAALTGALAAGCGVALLAVSGFLLARASQHPDIAALSVAVVAVRALSIGRGGFRYGERLASHDVAFRVLARARVAIWRRLESIAPAGLAAFHSGDLLTRLVSDVDATQDLFIRGLNPVFAAALVGFGSVLACLALVGGQAGLVLSAGLLVGGAIVPVLCLAAARWTGRRMSVARGRLGAAVTDLLSGAAELAAFGANGFALARAEAAGGEHAVAGRRVAATSGLASGLSTLVAGLTVWGVLLAGVAAVRAGTIDQVPLAVATLTALAAFEVVNVLPAAAVSISSVLASAGRITAVIDAPDPVAGPIGPVPLPAGPVTVRLRDACVRYEPGGPLALDGLTLDLPPGRRVALVGSNGAGKSTVAAVLLRFRDLTSGSAALAGGGDLAGGRSLTEFLADDVRTVIGGCPQDPHLFDASLAENLRLARPEASAAELERVLAQVGLADWIGSLPLGLQTQVGQNGSAVSGGQLQRIALARALLARPQVLVLDEPTAHLDAAGRTALLADLLGAASGQSILLISHDLEGLEQFDEIIVLEHGRVIQRGTHQELLAAGGRYRQLAGALVGAEVGGRAGEPGQLAAGRDAELAVDLGQVVLDGLDADVEASGRF